MLIYKKSWGMSLILVVVFLITGCATKGVDLLDYQNDVHSATVSWSMGERDFSADIVFGDGEEDEIVVNVAAPDEISGVSLYYCEDGITARTGGVSLELPDNTGREVYRIVRSMALVPEEAVGAGNGSGEVTAVRYEVSLFDGITEYDIVYGDDNRPRSAVIKWDDGEINVKYEGFAFRNVSGETDG